jgi:hypothetical protein
MPTGGFFGYAPNSRTTGNAGAASIFLTQITAPRSGTATAVLLDCFSATASTTFKALIYDSAHSVLLAASAQATSSVANYNRFALTTPLSITAGTNYFVGYVSSTAFAVTVQLAGQTSWLVSGGQSVTSPPNPLAAGASNSNGLMIAVELDGASSSGFGFSPDQAASVVLSASNTVATCPAASLKGARSIVTQLPGTGKWYAEVLLGGTLNNGVGVGLASANWGVVQTSFNALQYVNWLVPTGTLQLFSGNNTTGLTYASGDVLGIAYDAVNSRLWFNKHNGSWFGASTTAGNPATNTGGAVVQSVNWPVTIAATNGTNSSGTAAIFTLRDTAGALQYAPPSGFAVWSPATYPVLAAARRQVMIVG